MYIDNAVAAFNAAKPKFTIERSLVQHDRWVLKDADGQRLTSGIGHTHEECRQMRDDAVLAAKLSAAMQEMISVKTLTMAMMLSGAPDQQARAFAAQVLPNLITILGASEEDDGSVVGHA